MLRRIALLTSALALLVTSGVPKAQAAFTCNDYAAVDFGLFYVDVRNIGSQTITHVFAESGVSAGLQRGGTQFLVRFLGVGPTGAIRDRQCPYSVASDYLII